jgi:DNA methyltransferase 1-associated protein 1
VRTLTPAEESRYGVQHHERLSGGVQFRSDRAQKLTQAKSNVQTQKLASALAELEIPVRLFMPTERVCKDFEKLIQSVNLLLDARKVAEKVESEIRVLEATRAERERKNAPEGSSKDPEHPEVKTEADEGGNSMLGSTAADATESGGPARGETGQAKGDEAAPAATPVKEDGNHKRSASVLSSVSNKSSKRQRR